MARAHLSAGGLLLALLLVGCGGGQAGPTAAPAASSPVAQKASASASAAVQKPSASTAPAPSAGSLKPIQVAYVALATSTFPTWIADTKGFFKQQGLNAQVTYVQGSSTALPALASGNLDVLEAQPAVSVEGQLKGEDTVVLATHIPYADQRIVARPEIKTMDDLRGKSIAVSKAGTVTDNVVRWVLQHYKLTPGKDVKVTYLNTQPGQLAAVQNGLVAATMIPAPYDLVAEKNGSHLLLDVRTLNYAYPVDGVVSTRKFVRAHPREIVDYLKAYVMGVRFARSNPAESKQILAKYTKQSDPAVLDAAYKAQMADWADPPVPFLNGIKTVLPLYPGGAGKNPADFIDPKPMQQALKELGSTGSSGSPSAQPAKS